MRSRHALVLLASAIAACTPAEAPKPGASVVIKAAAQTPAPAPPSKLFDGMKLDTAPGDDFFAYVNGAWVATAEIPADRKDWGPSAELEERVDRQNADLIKAAGSNPSPEGQKVAAFFKAYLDEAAIEARGLAPLDEPLKAITAIKDKKDLAKALGGSVRADVDILNNTHEHTPNVVGLWVAEDLDNPKQVAAILLQGGLGMPERGYYLDPAARMVDLRKKYQAHIEKVLELAKMKDAKAKAARIFDLETKLADSHVPREDADDVEKGDNHWPRSGFDGKAPGLDWNAFFTGAKLDRSSEFIVWHPKAITGLAALVQGQPLETWKDYLTFHAIDHVLMFLPKAFAQESFEFYERALGGVEAPRERWKNGIAATNYALGEAVGKLFVEKYMPPAEKARAQQMAKNIIAAFDKRIDSLTWMTPATKARAKAKLATLQVGVGYPDRFRDYSALVVKGDDPLGNIVRAEQFEYDRNLAKLGKPVDRGEWVMNPQLVNAVNLPVRNAIQFPAAILQPPFFDPSQPIAFDYANIGATIGHEISHSFDDTGSLFDETGKKQNWWTPDDLAHFKAAGAALAAQYDRYKPFPDASVNGKQTLGENIADLAGLAAAFDAYQLSLGGKPAPTLGGFTGNQQFFIAYAQGWRGKTRPDALRSRLLTDGHAPEEYRADTVRNLDAWYDAFSPKPGQALFLTPQERVRVW